MAEKINILTDPEKKKKLKTLLLLLSLLFIISIISVLITKLILGPEEEIKTPQNSTTQLSAVEKNASNHLNLQDHNPNITNALDKESVSKNSSITKEPLRAYRPIRKSKSKEEESTKKTPCPTPKKIDITHSKSQTVETHVTTRDEYFDELVVNRQNTPTKEYIDPNSDKVIMSGNGLGTTYISVSSPSKAKKLTKGFYIKVGTYKDPTLAIEKVKKLGLHYEIIQIDGGLTQVLIGKFYSRKSADLQMHNAKNVMNSPYIMEVK